MKRVEIMSRVKRIIGRLLYVSIGCILPNAHCRIRSLGKIGKWFRGNICAKLMLTAVGENINVYKHAEISEQVIIGNNSDIGLRAKIYGKCIIGNDVIMGPDVVIYTRNHRIDRLDVPIKYQGNTDEMPVIINDDVWIGHGAFILPGVTIGKGSVIGGRAVVSKDVPDYSIVVGNPGRIVKKRIETNS